MKVGQLMIDMAADVARLRTDMNRAVSTVDGAMAKIRSAAKLAMGALAALGLGLSIASFSGFIRGAIDAADSMAKLSQKTGLAVRDVAGLQLAYRQSGLGADLLEKSMARMAREMANGNDAFKAMGVNVRNVDGTLRPVREVLGDVADKFSTYRDGAEKAALAQEIFGKSGAEMIPMLNGGSEALREMDEWAEKLGLTMSAETAKQAEQFNDTLDLLGQGLQGVGRQIAAEMLPTLTSLAGELLTTATETGALQTASNALTVVLKSVYTVAASGIQILTNLGRAAGGAAAAVMAVLRGDFAGAKSIMDQVQLDNSAAWKSNVDSISRLWNDAGNAGVAAMAAVTGAATRAAPIVEKPGKAAKASLKAAKDEAMELYQKLTMKDIGLDPKFYADLNRLHGAYKQGKLTIDQYRNAVELLTSQQAFAQRLQKAQEEAHKAAVAAIDQHRSALQALASEEARRVDGIGDENKRLREEIQLIGLTAKQVTQRAIALNNATIAEKENLLARLQSNSHTTTREMAALQEEIRLLRERNELLGQRQYAEEMVQSHQQYLEMWQSIDRTAHDVFVNIWEDGAGTFKRLGKTLKAALLDWLYQLTVKRWIINIGASFSGNPSGFLQAFGMGGGQGGMMGNAGSMMRGASLIGNWLGFGSGAAPGTLALANAWGAMGGNSMSAFIAANGGWGTMGGGAMASGAGGLGGLAAGMAAVAAPLIIGAIVESNSRDRHGGAAYATSHWRDDPYARVIEGSTEWSPASADLPDRAAMLAELEALGITDGGRFGTNDRALYHYLEMARSRASMSGAGFDTPGLGRGNPDLGDFYRGQGYINPEELGWWSNKGADILAIDPQVVAASRAIAESVVAPLTDMARMLGDESEFRAIAGFANRGKGKLWGAMAIERDGQSIVDMERADYENAEEYMRAVYRGAMDAFDSLDLPEWAKGQVEGAQAAMDQLSGDKVGQEAAAIYQQTAAGIAQLYQSIQLMIDVFPDFSSATQDSLFALQELMGGMGNLQQAYSAYLQSYWTEEERASLLRRQVEVEFERMGLAMPASRDAFRALVEAQDLTTESGREAFAALMGVAGAFAELTNASVAAFAEAETLAGVIRDGLLGNIAAEDLGGQMADVVMTGMYNAIAGGFAEQITQIMMQGVINPVIQAAITGAAMSEVVSQAAIDRMVADAVRVAEALGAILDDPAFRDAMGRIESAVTSIGSSIARPEPVYVSHDARRQEAERARQEAERARQEAERARQQAIDEAAREQQRIANERLGLMKQLLQLEGNQAALRQIELQQLDPTNRALQERIWALQDAAEAEAKHAAALKEANDFLKNVTSNIKNFVAGLNTQTSNPAVNYDQAWAAYNTQLAFARAGDRDALGSITNYAGTLAEAIRQSAQTGAEADLLIGRLRGQLMALPERVSAEQLIVNAVEDMKNTLSGVLVQKFDQLDTNVDGLLTFDELQASGMASDAQIRALIARVDANGDGMISRQEATAANVLGVTTAVNTGTTSSEYWSNILNNNNASGFSGVRGRVGDVDNSVRRSNDMLEHGGYTLADYAGLNHVLLNHLRTRFDSAFDSFNTGLTVKSMHRGGEWMTFAQGGVFTNSIVSSPTAFRMGLMGEAGPEAIMPLARTSGGELGVRAIPDGGAGVAPLLAEMAALRAEVSALRAEARAQASAQVGMSKRAAVAGERVARVVDDWDRNGQPEQREEVTA